LRNLNSIKNKLGNVFEFLFVLTIGFGIFIYSSSLSFLEHSKNNSLKQVYNNFDFYFLIFYEIIALAVIGYFLRKRKWTLKEFNLEFSPKYIIVAIVLVIIRFSLNFLGVELLKNLNILQNNTSNIVLKMNLITILLLLTVNSFYEEVLLIGYIFQRLKKINSFVIILISFLLRFTFHTYQGLESTIFVFTISVASGLYYIYYKKLWPIILAHCFGNILNFLDYYKIIELY
jgi:membrane protease YdiL (CAAX protease family)